jgi:hypothetical protein
VGLARRELGLPNREHLQLRLARVQLTADEKFAFVWNFFYSYERTTIIDLPGVSPTIVRWIASVVKIYNTILNLVCFENKNIFFYFEKTLYPTTSGVVDVNSEVVRKYVNLHRLFTYFTLWSESTYVGNDARSNLNLEEWISCIVFGASKSKYIVLYLFEIFCAFILTSPHLIQG